GDVPGPASHATGTNPAASAGVTARGIDPATGTYIGPDGTVYRNVDTGPETSLETYMKAQQG
ncbi:MAG: virulence factor Mce, partial [Rhodococcus ruber]|nr:virulence factor Mce [Rhodococcus ruber]